MTKNISLYKDSECPMSSPWGAIQTRKKLAAGIWSVSTAGHGGIKLSRERNASMPDYMRSEGGWYEEDCQWSIAAVVFPLGFQRVIKIEGKPDRSEYDIAVDTLRNWYPAHYERFFDRVLAPGESMVKDEDQFKKDNVGNFVVSAAWGSWATWVPKGMVGVSVRRASDGKEQGFLVPAEEYNARRGFFVIDLERHKTVEIPRG
jgi:hypothetical protein